MHRKMLAHIIFSLPITTYYSPPLDDEILDLLSCSITTSSDDNNNNCVSKHRHQRHAIDKIVSYRPTVIYQFVYNLLIHTKSTQVMEYICTSLNETKIVTVVKDILTIWIPNRFAVEYLNTKICTLLSQIEKLVGIYPDLYNTPLDRCVGYHCADDIAAEYVLQQLTNTNARDVLLMILYNSPDIVKKFVSLLPSDSTHMDDIKEKLSWRRIYI